MEKLIEKLEAQTKDDKRNLRLLAESVIENIESDLARLKYDMEKGFDVTMNLEHMTYDVLHVIEAMKDYRTRIFALSVVVQDLRDAKDSK